MPRNKAFCKKRSALCVQFFLGVFYRIALFFGKFAFGFEVSDVFRVHAHAITGVNAGEDDAMSFFIQKRCRKTLLTPGIFKGVEAFYRNASHAS